MINIEMKIPLTEIVQAAAEKERGNTYFKQGNYDKAIERYTAGQS